MSGDMTDTSFMAKPLTPSALRWNRPVTGSAHRLTKTMVPVREVKRITSKCGRVELLRVSEFGEYAVTIDGRRVERRAGGLTQVKDFGIVFGLRNAKSAAAILTA